MQKLFELSGEDESVLRLQLPDGIFGFHGQQSVEKLFKAWLTALGEVYPFTHNLKVLSEQLAGRGENLPATTFDIFLLQPYGVRFDMTLGRLLMRRSEMRFERAWQS